MANENAPAGRDESLALGAAGVGLGDGSEQSNSDRTSSGTEDASSANMISVNIKFLRGNDFVMDVQRDITVFALKTRVRQRTEVEEDRQRLIYRGRVLVDSESLSTYKVESGHSLHMVARPQGFVPPSATSSTGAVSTNDETANPAAAANAAGARAGTIGQRLLMGMGVPPALGQGTGAGTTAGTAAGLVAEFQDNPGAFNGEAFLSNIFGLAGAGRGAAAEGGAVEDMNPAQMPQTPSLWNVVEGRGTRGTSSREATAATAHAGGVTRGSGAAAAHAGRGSGREVAEEGQMGLEHIRQGLLTLHTLLSGTISMTGQQGEQGESGTVDPVNATTRESGASRSSSARSASAVAVGDTESSAEVAMSNASPSAARVATHAVVTGEYAIATTAASQMSTPEIANDEAGATTATTTPASPELAARARRRVAIHQSASIAASSPTTLPVSTSSLRAPVAEPSRRVSDAANENGPSTFAGTGTAWLPDSMDSSQAISTSADVSGEDTNSEHRNREMPGVEGVSGTTVRWPLRGEVVERGLGARTSAAQSEGSSSDLGSRALSSGASASSFDNPPDLMSSSGESGVFSLEMSASDRDEEDDEGPPGLVSSSGDSDEWEETRWPASSHAFRPSRMAHSDDADEEEKGEDAGAQHLRGTRKFFVGQWLDVKDTVHNWLEATVMDISHSGTRLQIHYNGWPPRWDEWLSWDSPRIAPFRTRTQHLPHAQHVSPAPISAVHNAPITGMDDVRVVMPEVSRVLREIGPMVDELSSCCARYLEQDASTPISGERTVSHTLPWTRQRVNDGVAASAVAAESRAGDGYPKVSDLASDVAPLLDRLGRMLTDVAPHVARMGNRAEDGPEPGEIRRGSVRRTAAGLNRSGSRRSNARSRSPDRSPDTAFRQLVSTSSPAPTSSNINIHIHAIVPLRAPPSPSPPPPPPPTAAASAVATPTRAERPPLAVAGSRGSPWAGGLDTTGAPTSLLAAARAAVASRTSTEPIREPETSGGGTPRSLTRGIVTDSPRSLLARPSADEGTVELSSSGGSSGGFSRSSRSRSASAASSTSIDVGVSSTPRGASSTMVEQIATPTLGSSAAIHSEPVGGRSASDGGEARPDQSANGGQRRPGGWRSILRALGVGGGGSSSRVGGRRDGSEGDSAPP